MDGSPIPYEDRLSGESLIFYTACEKLIERGFLVLPCRQNKQPFTPHGFKDATRNLDEVYIWAQDMPGAQPAVACALSGLVVIDVDDVEAFETHLRTHGVSAPETLTAETPSGGMHLYFRVPTGIILAGRLCDGVDIKHEGYVLAPPATAYSKRAERAGVYRWKDEAQPIADLPDWPGLIKARPRVSTERGVPASFSEKPAAPNNRLQSELEELVFYIPPDIEYLKWFSTLGAIYVATGGSAEGLALAIRWSSRGLKYKPGEVERIWPTLSLGKSAGKQYIAALAAQHGADVGAIWSKYNFGLEGEDMDVSGLLKTAEDSASTAPDSVPLATTAAHATHEVRVRQRAQTFRSTTIVGSEAKPILDHDYLIKGWLGRGELSMIYGPSNAGKTFAALHIANHLAKTLEWNGCRVRGGPVVYVAAEGGRALENRLVALPGGASSNLHLVPEPIDLFSDQVDTHAIVQLVREVLGDEIAPALIVIDTLARSIGGADENTGQDTARVISHVDFIRKATGANVMLVHHTGKDIERGARGHSSLRAAVDTEIFCGKKDGVRYLEATKQRNMETGAKLPFQLAPYVLGEDEDGDVKTTCYVDFLDGDAATKPKSGSGKNHTKVRRFFQEYLHKVHAEDGAETPGGTPMPSEVDRSEFLKFAAPKMGKDSLKAAQRAARDAVNDLVKGGELVENGFSLSLPDRDEKPVS